MLNKAPKGGAKVIKNLETYLWNLTGKRTGKERYGWPGLYDRGVTYLKSSVGFLIGRVVCAGIEIRLLDR